MNSPTDNKAIAKALKQLSQLMELHGQNAFKSKALQAAAFKIERLPVRLDRQSEKEINAIPGIGASISQKITEYINTATLSELEALKKDTPEGVLMMMKIQGLGPKKLQVIWKEMGITSPGELLYACNENRLVAWKGFGTKTQDQLVKSINFLIEHSDAIHYAKAFVVAEQEMDFLKNGIPGSRFEYTGEFRRKCDTVKAIEFISTATKEELVSLITPVKEIVENAGAYITYYSEEGPLVKIHTVKSEAFTAAQFRITGSESHVQSVCQQAGFDAVQDLSMEDETSLYKAASLPYVPAECREDIYQLNDFTSPEGLLTYPQLKGCLHNHSTYSDGTAGLQEMAAACIAQGWEYFGICDHSKTAVYANGMPVERVRSQQAEIEKLNKDLAPFRIFKGIESDILANGDLDYDDEILESFDFVVASVHSGLKMDIKTATDRLIKAISNPFTTILGHPTGRLLLSREGYPVDMDAIINACAAHKVIIELNANPHRLDIDWRWVKKATDKGVFISINPDAHRVEGLLDMQFGVFAGRKGLLQTQNTFNALSSEAVAAWFLNKKKAKVALNS